MEGRIVVTGGASGINLPRLLVDVKGDLVAYLVSDRASYISYVVDHEDDLPHHGRERPMHDRRPNAAVLIRLQIKIPDMSIIKFMSRAFRARDLSRAAKRGKISRGRNDAEAAR